MWKAVEKQGRGIEPKIIFYQQFNLLSYRAWKERAGFSMSGSASTLEMFLIFFPLAPADHGRKTEPILYTAF